jgi:hypothetical protein
MGQAVRVRMHKSPSAVVANIASVLQRQIETRTGLPVLLLEDGPSDVELDIQAGAGAEAFEIKGPPRGGVRIVGHDERGLLFGVGKFLRTSVCEDGRFVPGLWRGVSAPQKPVRGIYFATHFHNYYHEAPIEEITQYVEDLGLWGLNVISVWFDMHHYRGIDDPQAQSMIARLRAILQAAKALGLGASLTLLANEGYADSPESLRADWTAGHDGYHHPRGGHYHVELCPSKPGAAELLLRWVDEKLAAFSDVDLDYLWIWPYDQGGCTCSQCKPWGINGFLRMAEPISQRFKRVFPRGRVILSSWYFDHFTDGEWEGLDRAFRVRPDWVDYLLADDYGDRFPSYPLEHGAPGGLPMVGFPEISMYSASPWGGFGANAFPDHLQALWQSAGYALAGGFPYSEGIYEDINKAICAQFYWQQDKPAWDTVREYIAFEYGAKVVDPIARAIAILERNLPRRRQDDGERSRFVLSTSAGADEAWSLVQGADRQMTPQAAAAWRWRVLYLRALIDYELVHHDGAISVRCEEAMYELTGIFHAQQAAYTVAPPTREALRANRQA